MSPPPPPTSPLPDKNISHSQNWNITSKIFSGNFVLDIKGKVDGQRVLALIHCMTLIRKSVVAFLHEGEKAIKHLADNRFLKDASLWSLGMGYDFLNFLLNFCPCVWKSARKSVQQNQMLLSGHGLHSVYNISHELLYMPLQPCTGKCKWKTVGQIRVI